MPGSRGLLIICEELKNCGLSGAEKSSSTQICSKTSNLTHDQDLTSVRRTPPPCKKFSDSLCAWAFLLALLFGIFLRERAWFCTPLGSPNAYDLAPRLVLTVRR